MSRFKWDIFMISGKISCDQYVANVETAFEPL